MTASATAPTDSVVFFLPLGGGESPDSPLGFLGYHPLGEGSHFHLVEVVVQCRNMVSPVTLVALLPLQT